MGKKIFSILATVVLSLLFLLTPSVWKASVPEYDFCVPSQTTLAEQVKVRGRVESGQADFVRSNLPLIAERIEVSLGSSVKKGQVLCRIDKASTLAAYRLFLSEVGIDTNQTSLEQIVTQMQSLPDDMKALLDNLTSTMDQNLLIDLMSEKLDRILEGATLLLPETLVAPCDGTVTQIGIYYTALSAPGGSLFTIGDPDMPTAILAVPESEIQKIKVGQSVTLKGDAFPGTRKARITRIGSTAAEASSLFSTAAAFLVYADFESAPPPIGCSFTASITVGQSADALTLPYEAILQVGNTEYVRIVKEDVLEEVPVQTGMETASGIQICSGVEADSIILLGDDDLSRFWKLKFDGEVSE